MAASAYFDAVQKLYVAYYGRPADTVGLNYWAEKIDAAKGDIQSVVNAFGTSAEAQSIYGNVSTVTQVNNVFKNILGRDADVTGLNFYAQKVANGEYSLASLAQRILDGATTGDDAKVVANKLAAAKVFTAAIDTAAEVLSYTGDTAAQQARDFLKNVTADTATVPTAEAAQTTVSGLTGASSNPGQTFSLTVGADTITGTAGNDTINALSIKADGSAGETFSGFDTIDGGAGKDTLNIYTTAGENEAFPATATVKNVEVVNVYNAGAAAALADASKFEGVTELWQHSAAAAVTKLAATTTAGFKATTGDLSVTAADAAATATVAFDNVSEGGTLSVSGTATGTLNSVKVTGTVKDTNSDGTVAGKNLNVTVGKDVETLSVNSGIKSTLTVTDGAGTKKVSTVDASASTGDLTYSAANTVATVKTGAGADTATIALAGTADVKAASLSTGAGDDTLTVSVTKGTATAVTANIDAGAGKDTINLTINTGVTYTVAAGEGDDSVVVTGTIKTTDKIDGGAGTDTISLAAKAAYVADDYIVFNKVITNFETLKLTGVTTGELDAKQLAAAYTTIDLNAGSTVKGVGSQAIVANGNTTVTADGYKAAAGADPITYAGTVSVTEKATGTVKVLAETAKLTVAANDGNAPAANNLTVTGEAKTVSVVINNSNDTKGTKVTTDDVLVVNSVTVANGTGADALKDLASLTLSGNGKATVTNNDGTKLVTVDASALNSVGTDGKAATGLTYTSSNTAAETIKLGAGLDVVTINASTYGKVDVVTGLNLVAQADDAKKVDTAKSDNLNVGVGGTFKAFTSTQTDLDFLLKDAAASADNNLVFAFGGDTYVFVDAGTAGLIDAADTVVKLTGTVNLDLLIDTLAAVAPV